MRNFILAVLFLVICVAGYMAAGIAHEMMPEEPALSNISWRHELTLQEEYDIRLLLAAEDWKIEDHFFYKVAKGQKTKFITFVGNEQWYFVDSK